jgi:hypothetical protein
MYYSGLKPLSYGFLGNVPLAQLTSDIREQEIAKTRQAFKLCEFRGVSLEEVAKLKAIGIVTVNQMLAEFVERTGFDGIAPLPKELRNAIIKARHLPEAAQY